MISLIRYGDKGADVAEVQRLLHHHGIKSIEIDGIFGDHTRTAVKLFQKENGLKQDGIVGPITWAKLDYEQAKYDNFSKSHTPSGLREMAVRVAEKYEGVKEGAKPNSGTHIDRWLAECGLGPGYAWCVAFVQGAFSEAARLLDKPDMLKPNTAGVMDLWNRAPKEWRVDVSEAKRGDLLLFGPKWTHIALITGYDDGYFLTIEGNTNGEGSRDGDRVARKRRLKWNNDKILGFLRVPEPVDGSVL